VAGQQPGLHVRVRAPGRGVVTFYARDKGDGLWTAMPSHICTSFSASKAFVNTKLYRIGCSFLVEVKEEKPHGGLVVIETFEVFVRGGLAAKNV